MPPRFSIWMVLAGVAAGIVAGYLAGSGVIGENPFHPNPGSKSGRRPGSSSAQTALPGVNAQVLLNDATRGILAGSRSPADLAEALEKCYLRAEDPRASMLEMFASWYQLQLLIDSMTVAEARNVLDLVLGEPRYDQLYSQTVPSLVAKIVDGEPKAGFQWILQHENPKLVSPALWAIARRDPDRAAEILRSGDLSTSKDPFGGNLDHVRNLIGIRAVEGGPDRFEQFADLLRSPGTYASSIPPQHLEEFAEMTLREFEASGARSSGIEDVMARWAVEDYGSFKSWYEVRPGDKLKNDSQIVFRVLESLLRNDQKKGLDFAERAFAESEFVARMVFQVSLNSGVDPVLWDDLAQRLPAEVELTSDFFAEHFKLGARPGPAVVLGGARCFRDRESRLKFLQTALGKVKSSFRSDTRIPAGEIEAARSQLREFGFSPSEREEVMGLFEEAVRSWSKMEMDSENLPSQ